MKSPKVQILLSVLLFASLCGAPHSPRTRVKSIKAAAAVVPTDGIMIRVVKPKSLKSGLGRREVTSEIKKNVAATTIQKAVRARTVRKSDASSATASSLRPRHRSRSRSASPKGAPRGRRSSVVDSSDIAPVIADDGFVG